LYILPNVLSDVVTRFIIPDLKMMQRTPSNKELSSLVDLYCITGGKRNEQLIKNKRKSNENGYRVIGERLQNMYEIKNFRKGDYFHEVKMIARPAIKIIA
jgi:hypothetical protein